MRAPCSSILLVVVARVAPQMWFDDIDLRLELARNATTRSGGWCRRGHPAAAADAALACCDAACGECVHKDCRKKSQGRCCPTELSRPCAHACDTGCVAAAGADPAPPCPSRAAGDAASRGRVAVLVAGLQRGFALFQQGGVWWSHLRHVHEPLRDDGWEVSTFLCLEDNAADGAARHDLRASELPAALLAPLRVARVALSAPCASDECVRSTNRAWRTPAAGAGVERLARCYDAARAAEGAVGGGGGFAWFVRTRPDNVWFADAPRVSRLSGLAIAARARALAFDGAIARSDDHLSFGWGRAPAPVSRNGARAHRGGPAAKAEAAAKAAAAAVDTAFLRAHRCTSPHVAACMRETADRADALAARGLAPLAHVDARRKCLILDDQFALVPRAHADRYFRRNATVPPAATAEAGEAPEHARGWHVCCDVNWAEAKFTLRLLELGSPIEIVAARARLSDVRTRHKNPECDITPCVPPNPKLCG